MAKQKPCPVCGKIFTPCQTVINGVYQWRREYCSWDCAQKAFARIEEMRAQQRREKMQNQDAE